MAERYDWNRVAEATEQVYVEMLADTRRGAGSLPAASGVGLASGVSR